MTAETRDTIEAFLAAFAETVADEVAKRLQDPSEMLTVKQVSRELGIAERTARDLVNGRDGEPGKLESLRVGGGNGRRMVERAALEAYKAERRRAG
jgi:limonene-1,2-epoxide hydrolase